MGDIGERLREARLARGWSQSELAHRAKVSLPTVWRYEKPGTPRDPHYLAAVEQALGVTIRDESWREEPEGLEEPGEAGPPETGFAAPRTREGSELARMVDPLDPPVRRMVLSDVRRKVTDYLAEEEGEGRRRAAAADEPRLRKEIDEGLTNEGNGER